MTEAPAWLAPLSPLTLRAEHAGVQVWRSPRGFVKVYAEASRGQRERAALCAGLPLRTPALLEVLEGPEGQLALLLEDVRQGARPPRRLPVEALAPAARLLAGLHAARLPEAPDAWAWARRWAQDSQDPTFSPELREALAETLPIGDTLCHLDLHPSNWVLRDADPVGLIDWSSCGRADPEADLAGLVFAAGGDPDRLPGVLLAWAEASGREPDPARAWLLLWREAERAAGGKQGPERARLEALAQRLRQGWVVAGEPHGAQRVGRAFPKPESAEAGPWSPEVAPALEARLRELLDEPLAGLEVFAGHSCNDVLRAEVGGQPRVVKVYNKPVAPWLFALERHLSQALAGAGVTVLSPVTRPGGAALFRVGPRPAALYPYVGDARVGSGRAELPRLARALAALHALGPLEQDFPQLPAPSPDLFTGRLQLGALEAQLSEAEQAQVREAFRALRALDGTLDPRALPQALVHGGLHRDHAGWHPELGVVIFDLEKLRRGPRLLDAVQTAYMAGYRNNDETLDPARVVGFLRAYHQALPLEEAERTLILPGLVSCFFHDLEAMAHEGFPVEARVRHARVLLEVLHNEANLRGALERYLEGA